MNFSAKISAMSFRSRLASFDASVPKEKVKPLPPEAPKELSTRAPQKEYVPSFELFRGTLYLDGAFYCICATAMSARMEVDSWERTHFFSSKPATLHIT